MADMINRVRVLNGHTSPETAYLVEDYPYSFRLRCKIRYWIETATKGQAKGRQRFVSQTTNPKVASTVWNKPKAATYGDIAVLYLDENDHVQWWGCGYWLYPDEDARARFMGICDQLPEEQRARYDSLVKVSRATNPRTWQEWENKVSAVVQHITETGTDPELEKGTWKGPNGLVYIGDDKLAAYVMEARKRLADLG